MMNNKKWLSIIPVLFLMVILGACSFVKSSAPSATPAESATPAPTSTPTRTPTPEFPLCPPPSAEGPGMFMGSKGAPLPEMQGIVMKVVNPQPPFELDETNVAVRFVGVYYRGIVVTTGGVQPTEGEVQELYMDGKKIELTSHDISSGCIQTKAFGSMPILFSANISSSYGMLVMTPDQIEQFTQMAPEQIEQSTQKTPEQKVSVEPGPSAANCTVVSFFPTPDPSSLFPQITSEDWTRGPLTAMVKIIVYSDFQ